MEVELLMNICLKPVVTTVLIVCVLRKGARVQGAELIKEQHRFHYHLRYKT